MPSYAIINLVFVNTNYVDSSPPYNHGKLQQFFHLRQPYDDSRGHDIDWNRQSATSTDGPGVSSDIFIGGNLIIGAGCAWDPPEPI